MNQIPDKYEHLIRYNGYYSNRSRGARRLVENGNDAAESIRIDEPPADNRRKANWARLIQKVYEVDPLKCTRCGATMRIVALIDDAGVIERILKHLSMWGPQPESRSPAGPDPPWPKGETIPLTYSPGTGYRLNRCPRIAVGQPSAASLTFSELTRQSGRIC
jgi:hypothetical protein